MIGQISGILLEKKPPQILIEAGSIGYEIDVPMSTFCSLPACGEKVTLRTHFAVREDGHFLYGFSTSEEREVFRQLIKVSGIGARTALAVLSGLPVSELAQAIARQETGRLMKIPGIGKKTAERMLFELRGKLDAFTGSASPAIASGISIPSHSSDILNALLALGYNEREAHAAMKILAEDVPVAEGIRLSLRQLAKM
ncbi:MAG: Holliday junction branch migration protein RuvA [Azoarcus sp.]|jgi:Holliday junction DNA helicase RuvA|nr:Holliday junction branch migration protein RuvA [Azoarcus sp.]